MALAGRRRIELAEAVVALVAEICGAPDEHFAPELEELWGDEHQTAALRSLRALLEGSTRVRQRHQASVSLRILPRVLGGVRRIQAAAEHAATVSLSAVTDNPVYLPPSGDRPLGVAYSNGGYHNGTATAAIDGLAFAHADLCQLAERLTDHVFQNPVTVGSALTSGRSSRCTWSRMARQKRHARPPHPRFSHSAALARTTPPP